MEKRVSVQAKLLAAFGLVVILMVALGAFAVARLGTDNRHLRNLALEVVPSMRSVGEIGVVMNKYRKDQFHYIVAKPADRPASAPGGVQGDLNDDLTIMQGYWRAYSSQGLIEDTTDRRLFDTFQADFHRYVTVTAPFEALADRGQPQAAASVVGDGAGDQLWDKLKTLIVAWNNHKVDTSKAGEDASQASYQQGTILVVGLLAIAVAIAAGVAVVLARRMTSSVREVGSAAKAIAQGDIDQHVRVRSRDELGEMAADFDAMIDYLAATVDVAESIAAGNLEVEVRPRSDRDALGIALAAMTDSLRRMSDENGRLLAQTRYEADTDALTGLANRRALLRDLDHRLAASDEPVLLALFDLDGFKEYNDTFGHPTGDALLARMGERLKQSLAGIATAYRMGGDEFCILAGAGEGDGEPIAARAAAALSERGEAFAIGCSYGVAYLPLDARSASDALRLADDRMYQNKTSRVSASRQTTDALLKALGERHPQLGDHINEVAELAARTAQRLDLPEAEVRRIRLAAELHDVGKVAIPDSILSKPEPLDEEEWQFMRRHTIIGERIVNAAPCLAAAAPLVRASHERHDGTGYPDQLPAEKIPMGAAIIAVCDAFEAMTARRPYSPPIPMPEALAELRRCSGTQFHPDVVVALCGLLEQDDAAELKAA